MLIKKLTLGKLTKYQIIKFDYKIYNLLTH